MRCIALSLFVVSLPVSLARCEEQLQNWSDVTGKFSVEARLTEVRKNAVLLERKDGTKVTVPFESLDRESLLRALKFAAGMSRKAGEPAAKKGDAAMKDGEPALSDRDAAEPLRNAWQPLAPGAEAIEERNKEMTSFQLYDLMKSQVRSLQKATAGKQYSLRLRVYGVIEPMVQYGYPKGIALVHGRYVDEAEREAFGEEATLGIWTEDFETAKSLKVGDEFLLTGKITFAVPPLDDDVEKPQSDLRIGHGVVPVILLKGKHTGFVRYVKIIMVDAKIVPIERIEQGSQNELSSD